jgi:hypothetical protein
MQAIDTAPENPTISVSAMSRRTVLAGLLATAGFAITPLTRPAFAAQSNPAPALIGAPSIVVRTTENVTEGSWVWLLNAARDAGVGRIYLLIKQDENGYASAATKRTLRSGELLAPVAGGVTAEGWDDPAWLDELLTRTHSFGIEVHAWWPCFQDAIAASRLPRARYPGRANEVFLDPGRAEVGAYQAALLKPLIERYPFDGVALDWIRYNDRADGAAGPLGKHFAEHAGRPWSKEAMADPFLRAMWDDLRARTIADWVKDLLSELRPSHPAMTWSAFVLPWMFKEVAQSYRHLSAAGLDSLQPMIYWRDWKENAGFTADVIGSAPFYLSGRTSLDPTFDITGEAAELAEALDFLPKDRLGSVTWYHHGAWSDEDFRKLAAVSAAFTSAQGELYHEAAPEPARLPTGLRLEPAQFPPDASVWSVICLGELYRREALNGAEPVIPVLAFHRFTEGAPESGPSDWHTSTDYLDALIAFVQAHGFTAMPAATLAAYMTSEDPKLLPTRPLVITIDDGSATIASHFEPRAASAGLPYAVALVTGWVSDAAEQVIDIGDGLTDRILTWGQAKTLAATGRASFISHSHEQHRYANSGPTGAESGPAITTRLWIGADPRQESEAERLRRVFGDLAASREALMQHFGGPSTILVWPYGERDERAESAATDAGFTHFFEFGGNAFAAPRQNPRRIMRVPVMLADEAIAVSFPTDHLIAQRWWLAFQVWTRSTQCVDLIEAALAQLDTPQEAHPQAEISRAAALVLNGHATLAQRRMTALRNLYPHDSTIHSSIDDFEAAYKGFA